MKGFPVLLRFSPLLILVGCASYSTLDATFFPVEGPMSKQRPVPTFVATATGARSYSGEMSLTMPDGEYCSGKWAIARGQGSSRTSANLMTEYGWVHGRSTTVTKDSNPASGAGVLTCDQGTFVDVEFVTGAGTGSGYGVAKDNNGNVYRVIF